MGVCQSQPRDQESDMAHQADRAHSKKMLDKKRTDRAILKVLLLGTGESGKSTILKQLNLLYSSGFSRLNQANFAHVLQSNVVQCMQTLVDAAHEFKIAIEPEFVDDAELVEELDALSPEMGLGERTSVAIKKLWEESAAIKQVYERKNETQLLDSASYLFNNLERIGAVDFQPTTEDMLRARLRTSGLTESKMSLNGRNFLFIDVGGQKNERRKWIHSFSSVTAVLFVVAVNEFDKNLFEEEEKNRMLDSLAVWRKTMGMKCFQNCAVILFLNKNDLLAEQMQKPASHERLKALFPLYEGKTLEDAQSFIKQQYLAVEREVDPIERRSVPRVTTRFTSAIDRGQMEQIMKACVDSIIQRALSQMGVMQI